MALFVLLFSPLLLLAQGESLFIQEGTASYYASKFQGKRTASGEVYVKDSLTAAHKLLPFGTVLRVTNQKNGNTVVVRVNDRLPSSSKRVIDLSYAAAKKVDMIRDGLAKVRIEAVDLDQLDQLVDYFADREHPGLRIRRYYRVIPTPRREMDLKLKTLETAQLLSITFL
ncbi:MAG: septal ring lytic transglycosylase RlpA family protein [Algoriphagus sp.]|nr:septal ring lytic transglycosylase RlpA family protein [Algoriphagus sp.]